VGALLLLAPPARAQRPSAEALYEAGALRAAADSFAARAAAEPQVAAHWYDLGATLYRAGADGKATAAWTLAARLAPRNAVVRRARRLLPPPDAASESLLAVGPATPAEWWFAATLAWGGGCWSGMCRRCEPQDRRSAVHGGRPDRRGRGGRAAGLGRQGISGKRARCGRPRHPRRARGWRQDTDPGERRRRGHER